MKYNLLKWAFVAVFSMVFHLGFAQTNFADFRVKTTDGDGKPLSGVEVKMYLNGIFKTSDTTDADGNAIFQTLSPGVYDVELSKEGSTDQKVTGLNLTAGLNEQLKVSMTGRMGDVIITTKSTNKVIQMEKNEQQVTGKAMINSGRRGVGALTATNSAIVESRQGISVRGTRSDGNGTFIDGVRAIGGGALPSLGVEGISVNIGGIPAMYGDLTGGAFSYTSKSATDKFISIFEGITSQFLDPYSYSTVEGFISGPLWIEQKKNSAGKTEKNVKLGFTLNGNLGYFGDPDPTRTGVYVLNQDKLNQIKQDPLVFTPNGFVHQASYLRESDFTRLDARPNSAQYNGNLIGKLEYNPNKNIAVTAFASYFYSGGRGVTNNILNFENTARVDNSTVRAYLQFKQNFEVDKTSSIKSAFYTVRAEYQNAWSFTRNADHMDNIFDYGYVGKFQAHPTEFFAYSHSDQQENPNREPKIVRDQLGNYVQIRDYWEQVGFFDTLLKYTPGTQNPDRARYTQNIYDFFGSRGATISNPFSVLVNQGLLNGYNPQNVYSLWNTPGTTVGSWNKSENERISLFALGQMQVKPKTIAGRERTPHDLQAGFYYEQNINRGYGLNANGLWILMNQLMNSHIAELDVNNPILSYDANGVFTDTVRYNRLVNYEQQSHFDRQFRNRLIASGAKDVYGNLINERTFVDINSYNPADFLGENAKNGFDLSLFNANELLNNGNNYASYFGYDHLGNRLRGRPSINDFLNNPDKRSIGAFQPIYIAAWIQDQFQFKDLIFRLGLRMERYDANQLVMADPYSLYPIRKVSEVKNLPGSDDINHPSNISKDAYVYVNDMQAPTRIIGYREGDRWFNADGSEQRNSEFLANQTTNGRIAPYLVDYGRQEVTDKTFRDYTPLVNLLPRIWFSFPLEPGRKSFYVSYDVLAQRPNAGASFVSIQDIYFLKFRQGSTVANGALNTRMKTDYEVGYKQIFGSKKNMGLEISASYSEIRNDFGLFQINQGYPVTYTTYRNIDFATITGFRGNFNIRDIGPLTLSASYMLQFADGTGSNINSQQALIASNQPNLRTVIPLGELDIRHNIKLSGTWAWAGGKDPRTRKNMYTGPVLWGTEIFKFTSINIIANTYSGGPYTPTVRAVQIGAVDRAQIKGRPFGARLPWQYNFDLNFTKGVQINRENSDNPLVFNVFLWVNNVLNTWNVLGVFPYTGQPNDDGFLNSPAGQLLVKTQIDAQSYIDLYRLLLNSQTGNWNGPRTIRLGVRFNLN
jgi:hypothetical protein